MNQSLVVLKSSRYGLIIQLDPTVPFEKLRMAVAHKFRDSAPFFGEAQMVISFAGRVLNDREECLLVSAISDNSELKIACILDLNEETEEKQKKALEEAAASKGQRTQEALLYRGTLMNGEQLDAPKNIVIFGDVNPGARVNAEGNIFVFGNCMGTVCAGIKGDSNAVIAALSLRPRMMSLSGKVLRSAIRKNEDSGDYDVEPKIARIADGQIEMKTVTFEYLREIVN